MHNVTRHTFALAALIVAASFTAIHAGEPPKIPDGFPEDVTIGKDWVCQMAMEVQGSYMLTFFTKDKSLGDLVDMYKKSMEKQGWETQATMITADNAILPFKKGKRTCGISMVGFIMDGGEKKEGCTVTMQVAGEPEAKDGKAVESKATEAASEE